jgi:transcriptional regulator with XRE-family HTH domain
MKRKLTKFRDYERQAQKQDPVYREAYLEVLGEEIGRELRSLRESAGKTQAQIAERMGYAHRSRIAQIESSQGLSLALETIARYAQATGYQVKLVFESVSREDSRTITLSHLPQRQPRPCFFETHKYFATDGVKDVRVAGIHDEFEVGRNWSSSKQRPPIGKWTQRSVTVKPAIVGPKANLARTAVPIVAA